MPAIPDLNSLNLFMKQLKKSGGQEPYEGQDRNSCQRIWGARGG
jgi:hypothetical protein